MVIIKHKLTGKILHKFPELKTLAGANLSHLNLNGADLAGQDFTGTCFRHAYLREADLSGARLIRADFKHANLSEANLDYANATETDFSHANLVYTRLYYAHLQDVNLLHAIIRWTDFSLATLGEVRLLDGGFRSDRFRFFYTDFPGEGPRIKAGCRNFTPAQAIRHWTKTRADTKLGFESLQIVEHLLKMVSIRNWGKPYPHKKNS